MVPIANISRISVWDPFVRVGHWALVAAFTIAYLTGEEEGSSSESHEWAGYTVGAIVAWRILWGFLGPEHARFNDFVTGPISASRYLRELIAGHARRFLGHSPAGGAMVVALLLFLAATVITGVLADQNAGIAAGRTTEGAEGLLGEIHGALANITLALALFHILCVALASLAHRENLLEAMITGKKRLEDSSAPK
jgi:cytochrome b